jgi:hypothetical protein
MIQDVLSLGGVVFDSYSTPDIFSDGGRQVLIVHKLPGGARVIDELGPDPMEIVWRGQFFGQDAYATALLLDSMRKAGPVLPLVFAGQTRQVIIANFIYSLRRLPLWVEYVVTCTVVPAQGATGIGNDTQAAINTDLANSNNTQSLPSPAGPITSPEFAGPP